MAYSPPKKITIIFSFIFLAIGLFLLIELFFGLTGIFAYLPALTFGLPLVNSYQMYGIIAMFFVFLSWLLLILGVRIRGM